MSNNCFTCNSIITGNIFKAYDKNLCSYSCREYLIQNYSFNSNFQLEKKVNRKKVDNLINKNINHGKNIENEELEALYKKNYKSFINKEVASTRLSGLFDLPSPILKEHKVNIEKTYEKENPRICLNIYTEYYNDLTFINIITKIVEKAKNLVI